MGTKVSVDHTSLDNLDEWDDDFSDKGSYRKKAGRDRRRDIEERLEEKRLRRQIESSYDADDYSWS
ncbi:hypothetical protein [Marinobacterium arenosum]|uniref:hypothetical protein n=1 Tax=Marinobacterium arenosum TaxID=2862496 RepID=UPI001C951A4C|nr:hypothetical protein [Marinobacterium arenosum]MBY4675695.1 hypothetical protein [Marinobacterium arenosum]